MKIHRLKLRVEYCDDVLKCIKTFEIRRNDRDFKVGDLILFTPVDDFGEFKHQISNEIFYITYMISDFPDGLQKDYVVLGITCVEISQLPF